MCQRNFNASAFSTYYREQPSSTQQCQHHVRVALDDQFHVDTQCLKRLGQLTPPYIGAFELNPF